MPRRFIDRAPEPDARRATRLSSSKAERLTSEHLERGPRAVDLDEGGK
jgi:hypothetical protein